MTVQVYVLALNLDLLFNIIYLSLTNKEKDHFLFNRLIHRLSLFAVIFSLFGCVGSDKSNIELIEEEAFNEKVEIKNYESLDNYLVELKTLGSLTALCGNDNYRIIECKKAIGEWKPEKFARAKLEVPACFDKCMLDSFGFYKDSQTGKEIPAVRTKDFDASAPSRGFEATFYPVAVKIFRYEGCAGCALTYQYPTKLDVEIGKESFSLPILTRGGYYLPSRFRSLISNDPSQKIRFRAKTTEGEFIMNISNKTVAEYVKMLELLNYN